MIRRGILTLCWLVAEVSLFPFATRAEGCATVRWSSPMRISRQGHFSCAPALVADSAGGVHLFWTEYLEVSEKGESLAPQTDAIMYSRWQGDGWSSPVDVLPSPDGASIVASYAAVDTIGGLHVLWFTRAGNLYYSAAAVAHAAEARAWTAPLRLSTGLSTLQLPAAIAVDPFNTIHVVYTVGGASGDVTYIHSMDGGMTWSPPLSLSSEMTLANTLPLVASTVVLAVGGDGDLHVGWTMNDGEGFGVYILYTQSLDGGQTWTKPVVVAERADGDYEADWLSIAPRGDDQVLLVWGGVGNPPGRSYRLSTDGGLTWHPPVHFMRGLVGETEAIRMVSDGQGNTHLFTPARSSDEALAHGSGMRHLCWDGISWTQPELLPGPSEKPERYGGLATSAAVRLGNEFFVAYHDQGKGSVEVFHGLLDIPSQQPSVFSMEGPAGLLTLTPSSLPEVSQSTPPPTPLGWVAAPANRGGADVANGLPVVAGALSAVTLCGLIIVARRRWR